MPTTLPATPTPANIDIVWVANSMVYLSPLSGAMSTSSRLGGGWALTLTYPPMLPLDAGGFQAALMGADGPATAISVGPDHQHPLDWHDPAAIFAAPSAPTLMLLPTKALYYSRYVTAPSPTVNGAVSAGATSFPVSDLDGHGFNAGDWISFSNGTYSELHIVTADAFPDASGDATLTIHPPTRRAISDAVAVLIENPVGEFILSKPDGASSGLDNRGVVSISVELREFVR